ncbi:MAG: hypothetical protein AAGA03_12435 [Planctomycetota bacterium]
MAVGQRRKKKRRTGWTSPPFRESLGEVNRLRRRCWRLASELAGQLLQHHCCWKLPQQRQDRPFERCQGRRFRPEPGRSLKSLEPIPSPSVQQLRHSKELVRVQELRSKERARVHNMVPEQELARSRALVRARSTVPVQARSMALEPVLVRSMVPGQVHSKALVRARSMVPEQARSTSKRSGPSAWPASRHHMPCGHAAWKTVHHHRS